MCDFSHKKTLLRRTLFGFQENGRKTRQQKEKGEKIGKEGGKNPGIAHVKETDMNHIMFMLEIFNSVINHTAKS